MYTFDTIDTECTIDTCRVHGVYIV